MNKRKLKLFLIYIMVASTVFTAGFFAGEKFKSEKDSVYTLSKLGSQGEKNTE